MVGLGVERQDHFAMVTALSWLITEKLNEHEMFALVGLPDLGLLEVDNPKDICSTVGDQIFFLLYL